MLSWPAASAGRPGAQDECGVGVGGACAVAQRSQERVAFSGVAAGDA
jgi:hypothetical protein